MTEQEKKRKKEKERRRRWSIDNSSTPTDYTGIFNTPESDLGSNSSITNDPPSNDSGSFDGFGGGDSGGGGASDSF